MPKQNPCLKAFQACGEKGREFQTFLDGRWPNFWCECTTVSPFSCGVVTDDEEIIRLVVHPIHYDNGKLTATAFEDLTTNDLSVFRVGKSSRKEVEKTRDELILRGQEKNPPKIRMIDVACRANVSEIRGKTDNLGRVLGVYDTALKDCEGHASLFTRTDMLLDKKARLRARQIAHELFTARIEKLDISLSEMNP
jgi:hypothetical protein